MEMKNVIAREGREAKNLILYHLSSEDEKTNVKKPPTHVRPSVLNQRKISLTDTKSPDKSNRRVRSASTGRDKRSELQARYWALLLANLQRAVNDIYQTVECYENLASCQEVILVLENYTRDFRSLADFWCRVSWDYEAIPQPQRPPFLAWEVRKSNPAPPIRAKSLSSPSPNASGNSSPCPSFSGKISPTVDDMKSPRKKFLDIKTNVALTSKPSSDRNPKSPRLHLNTKLTESNGPLFPSENGNPTAETELTKIPEETQQMTWGDLVEQEESSSSQNDSLQQPLEGNVQESCESVLTFDQYSQTSGFTDEYLTLQQWRDKYEKNEDTNVIVSNTDSVESAVLHTRNKLDEMENVFLEKNTNQPSNLIQTTVEVSKENELNAKNDTFINGGGDDKPKSAIVDEDVGKKVTHPDEKKVQTGNQMKYSNVVVRLSSAFKPNNLPKGPSQRINAGPNRNTTSTNVAGRSNLVGNPNVIRRQPIRSAPIAPMNRGKVVASKESATKDLDRTNTRPRTAGIPTNTASRLAARSRTMIELNNKAPVNHFTIQKSVSRDSMGSSSSTLRASNDQISNSQTKLNARRSEPRTLTGVRNEDEDGWLTVKARRRTSLHWSNRFNQPSGYASLPTLALLNEKDSPKSCNKKENRKNGKTPQNSASNEETSKLRAKAIAVSTTNGANNKDDTVLPSSAATTTTSVTSTSTSTSTKSETNIAEPKLKPKSPPVENKTKTVTAKDNAKSVPIVSRATILQRQRSDITGLKLNSLRKEYFRIEKIKKQKDSKKALAKEQTKDPKTSVNMNVQTNGRTGLSSAMRELYTSCLESESSIANDINKRDTESDDTEIESDENQRKLLEEQWSLEREIFELQNTEIDVDTEIDEAECDNILGLSSGDSNSELIQNDECDDNEMSLEAKYQHLLSDMSTGERIQTLATLQAFVSRHPGRAQELHQKLSSPSHRSLTEILKNYQEKQDRARDVRESLNKEKTLKLQALLARVEDVKVAKQKLIDEKRYRMEEKLQRYAENRNQYIKQKIRKAHDEEEKLKEIAFIKSLEAQNKRLDLMDLRKEQEGRLQDLEAERQKRVEEKAAKEAAVERRRLELAIERKKRLERIDETRREREQRVVSMQEEREKVRQQIARDKARDREERLLALQVQQQQTTEELQRKIEQKQQESARRHEENIEHIRQRALELSIPSRNVDDPNRNDDGYENTANDDLSSTISDVSVDQTKASKKKLKKLRQRMVQMAEEYMKDLEPVPLYMKRDSAIPKILSAMRKGGGPQGMERPLGQLSRTIAKAEVFDFQCLWLMDGLGTLATIIQSGIEPNSEISRKALIMAIQIYRDACSPCVQIARHAILGNSVSILFDVLLRSLQTPDEKTSTHPIELSTELMLATTVVLSPFNVLKQPHPKVLERLPDIVSYAVSIGLIDALSKRCMKIREPIESHQSVVLSVLACLGLLTKFTDICPKETSAPKLLSVIKSTELFGTISLLYATIVPVGECIPPRTISVAASAFNLILTIANLDLNAFQAIMSEESLSLQFLDVVTILLKYCGPKSNENTETQAVIVDLVATLGFFCANNKENQNLLISDQSSVIIKSLSKLPKFFDIVVYPTLLTMTSDNDGAKTVIGKEFDLKRLEDYENSEASKKNKMLAILNSNSKENKKSNK